MVKSFNEDAKATQDGEKKMSPQKMGIRKTRYPYPMEGKNEAPTPN